MRNNFKVYNILIMICTLTFFSIIAIASDTNNVGFKGMLVSRPCQLETGSENLEVNFGETAEKYFYTNIRTAGKSLVIKLVKCDVNTQKSVRVKFTGQESNQLPGLLIVTDKTISTGLAIGIETDDGTAIAINKSGPLKEINMVENAIHVKAYLQGEPEAVTKRKVTLGEFTVSAGFELEYE